MSCDLAKNRINILSINYLCKNEYSIIFEYAYYNKDHSKIWAKDFIVIHTDRMTGNGTIERINKEVVRYTAILRNELER